ncbi:MAG TPA: hypothetical protein VN844_13765 [Pyrinomonadaceae bacterium]|nr:hypothetical protein [Pyrinomonadaceae bacterium]
MTECSSEPATRQSWPNIKPLPEQRAALSLERAFTEEEFELIRYGSIPEAMENKWFIFLEDDVLYFHRSWTGFCIYQVSLKKDGAQYRVVEALANRDSTQYSAADDHYDVNLLNFLIDNFLLQRPPREEITPMSATRWVWAWLKWLVRG